MRAVSEISVSRRLVMEIATSGPGLLPWGDGDAIEGGRIAYLAWNRGAGKESITATQVNGKLSMTYRHRLGGLHEVTEHINPYRFIQLWIQGCQKPCDVPAIKAAAAGVINQIRKPSQISNGRFREIQEHLLQAAWLSI